MSPCSIITVEVDAVSGRTWMIFWNSLTIDKRSVAVVTVATVGPIFMVFPDHCFTQCQGGSINI